VEVMPTKEGWTHEQNHEKITLGKKQYRNMEEWSRPCAACAKPFSIFVRMNTTGINSNFGYRNCKDHRGQKVAGSIAPISNEDAEIMEEWRKVWKECHPLLLPHGLVGVDTFAAAVQRLSDQNVARFSELQPLKAENHDLRMRLAKYELQPALEAQAKIFPWNENSS
jgi:hypothetical protein